MLHWRAGLVMVLLTLAGCASQPSAPPVSLPSAPEVVAEPPAQTIIQHGKASYYADHFHGQTTADGSSFDQNALTGASKVIPLGAKATVTNVSTGQSVTVEVNDRGPHVRGRVIDLSKRAAESIGIDGEKGVARVKVEARAADQPTPELREKVAAIAAARDVKKTRRAELHQADTSGP